MPDDLPPIPPAPAFDIVRVAPGDTLQKIAKRRLGDAHRSREIFHMNRDLLEDADHIYLGMPLRVPKA